MTRRYADPDRVARLHPINTTRYTLAWGHGPQGRREVWCVCKPGQMFWYRGTFEALEREFRELPGAWWLSPVPQVDYPDHIKQLLGANTMELIEQLIAQAETEGVRTGLAGLTDEQRAVEVRQRIDEIVPVAWPADDEGDGAWLSPVVADPGNDEPVKNCSCCSLPFRASGDTCPTCRREGCGSTTERGSNDE